MLCLYTNPPRDKADWDQVIYEGFIPRKTSGFRTLACGAIKVNLRIQLLWTGTHAHGPQSFGNIRSPRFLRSRSEASHSHTEF